LSIVEAVSHVADPQCANESLCGFDLSALCGPIVTMRSGTNYAALVGCGRCYAAVLTRLHIEREHGRAGRVGKA
jgi:hypothetical protein